MKYTVLLKVVCQYRVVNLLNSMAINVLMFIKANVRLLCGTEHWTYSLNDLQYKSTRFERRCLTCAALVNKAQAAILLYWSRAIKICTHSNMKLLSVVFYWFNVMAWGCTGKREMIHDTGVDIISPWLRDQGDEIVIK